MVQIFAEKKRVKRVLVYLLVASRYGKGRQTPKKRRHFLTRRFSALMYVLLIHIIKVISSYQAFLDLSKSPLFAN